ncbi:SapC family protein [Marilutibacter aestuarii]|uniref:SapC family protein n=1 Tax=Marilutibacter aestuarii TaxID=1706195 RepID=A0A508ACW4_9GAMM|nr:SapC family protein [Lysobacter aestuarii]TQD44895.1 SapC family protein [Lysobacter aestuarii]
MTRHTALNNIDHRDLRVDPRRGARMGDDVMFAPTFPAEFRNVQAHYPIVFHKDGQGRFQPVALFGFRQGQNLFLRGERWDATYLPLAMERQPFLIGRSGTELAVHIDLDHPRVGTATGEPLFREHGGSSDYLERMTSMLRTLHDGLEATPAFIDALLRHELLESFVLDVQLDDGAQHRLAGFYTVQEDRLRALDADAFLALHRDGHLEPLYMVLASLAQLRVLIERINRPDDAT